MKLTYLTCCDNESNKFRFYQMYVTQGVLGDWALVREWGRIGSPGKIRSDWFDTEENAFKAGVAIKRLKLKNGYVCKNISPY